MSQLKTCPQCGNKTSYFEDDCPYCPHVFETLSSPVSDAAPATPDRVQQLESALRLTTNLLERIKATAEDCIQEPDIFRHDPQWLVKNCTEALAAARAITEAK